MPARIQDLAIAGPTPQPPVDAQTAQLIIDSLRLREKLEGQGGAEQQRLAQRYWVSVGDFTALANQFSPTDRALHSRLLENYSRIIRQQSAVGGAADLGVVREVEMSLREQVALTRVSLARNGGNTAAINVDIRALNAQGQPVNGLYVWVDLACCVAPGWSANPLPRVTSPSHAQVIPATYVIRLMRGERPVGRREVKIEGAGGTRVPVDVMVDE